MAKRTGPSNANLQQLIVDLKTKAINDNVNLWKKVALELEKPTRNKRIVNLSRLNRFTKESEIVIVPGKLLGSGSIDHNVTIAAFAFSEGAIEKLKAKNCKVLSIEDLMVSKTEPKDIRIIG